MYEESQITPKKRPESSIFVHSTLRSVSTSGNDKPDSAAACHGNRKISDVCYSRRPQSQDGGTSRFQMAQSSPLHLPTGEDESSKMDFSVLDSMRLGFNWLQNNHSTQLNREVSRITPRKSQSSTNYILNPFESDLIETMQMSSCSPSVFSKVVTPSKVENDDEAFSWGVENAAMLYPKEFDDMHNQTASMVDQEMEEKLQSAINTYFTQKIFVPSPWVANEIRDVNRSSLTSDNENCEPKLPQKRSVWSQTALTIPPEVDIQAILGKYFTFTESQDQCDDYGGQEVMSVSHPRRKLFLDGEVHDHSNFVGTSETVTQEKSLEVIQSSHDSFDGSSQHLDLLNDRYKRATSVSPPKHIKTPTDSPIKPLSGDESLHDENQDECCLSSVFIPENEPNVSNAQETGEGIEEILAGSDWISIEYFADLAENTSLIIINVDEFHVKDDQNLVQMEKDTGYLTGGTIPTISPNTQDFSLFSSSLQAPVSNLNPSTDEGTSSQALLLPHNSKYELQRPYFVKTNTSDEFGQSDTSWSPMVFSTPSKQNQST